MNPRVLYAVSAFLLVIGLALPIAAVSKKGAPWGYRGHRGVIAELVGDTQVSDPDGNKKSAARGAWLEVGDELRAGRYSTVRAELPEGAFTLGDGGVARMTAKGLLFVSGAIDVVVPVGPRNLKLEIEGFDSVLTIRPAAEAGRVRVVADGRSVAVAHVRAGSLDESGRNVELGQVVKLVRGQQPVASASPTSVALTAACDGARITVTTLVGVQVFVPGTARVSDGTPLALDVLPGRKAVVINARDVVGNVFGPQEVSCQAAQAPVVPKPPPKPVPPKPVPPKPVAPKTP